MLPKSNAKGKKMKREKNLTIRVSEEEYKRIENIANKIGIPKTRLARNLIIAGLEDAELLDKLGAFDIAKLIEKIREKALGQNYKLITE